MTKYTSGLIGNHGASPVLAAFREDSSLYDSPSAAAIAWLEAGPVIEYVATKYGATVDHERHAARVLNRLAVL